MCLEMSNIVMKSIQKVLTSDRFNIWIRCFSIRIPVLNHFLPFQYGVGWKGGCKLVMVFLLPLRHCDGLLERIQKTGT